MLAYFSAVLSGDEDALRSALLFGSVFGGVLVGVGVIWEAKKLDAATATVFVGIVLEAACTIFLFVTDEGISRRQQSIIEAQQSKIIALEIKLAPRTISPQQREQVAGLMRQFAPQEYWGMAASDVSDAWNLWREISLGLELAGWKRLPPPGLAATQFGPPAGIAIAPQEGVMILYSAASLSLLHSQAEALAKALTDIGILTGSAAASGSPVNTPNAVAIVIGPKPQ
jgi:hypothetical protein